MTRQGKGINIDIAKKHKKTSLKLGEAKDSQGNDNKVKEKTTKRQDNRKHINHVKVGGGNKQRNDGK